MTPRPYYPPPGWTSLPNMSTPRGSAGGVAINDHQFLVIGGNHTSSLYGERLIFVLPRLGYLSSSEYLDTRTGTWNDLGVDLPEGLAAHGTAFVGDKVFVIGGVTSDGADGVTARNRVLALTVPNGDLSAITQGQNWESLPPMTQARFWFGCASDDRFIYVFGGHDGNRELSTAERFDTETYEWTSLPDVPTNTFGSKNFEAAMVGDKIFLLGGNDRYCVDVFNVTRREWDSNAVFNLVANQDYPGISKSSHSVVAVLDRFLVVLGGTIHYRSKDLVIDTAATTERGEYHTLPILNEGNRRRSCVTGVLKGNGNDVTIIIAGDREVNGGQQPVSNRAESISFISGILPPRFRKRLFDSWLFEFLRNDFANHWSRHQS